ncbi:unnamed protein product [Lactuca saligna]|uniref:DDE Tnp4 domain-containing protein n=1 Tax=Lactuca saligna TaxID=75948 RepID=A0AA35Y8V1_LACSI|nr:unnamed protein product [Lactuca saligna]
MTRRCFTKLCDMLHTLGGLRTSRHMDINEQVAIFLHIIAHNVKNRVMIGRFQRSGETISKIVSRVCNAVIRLHPHLLKKPEPVTENSTDQRWKWFKNYLGALDGTHIKCLVPLKDKPKYKTRKNDIATNVLGVCSQDMQFIYVLPGWEGSAADDRVLRDALIRPHGLKVIILDAGYTNGEGFLALYRVQRYHLNEWRAGHQPTTPKELFNMRHSSARNVIERCFGLMEKIRNYRNWTITEDVKLVETLVNMVNIGGFKADNGFKYGYLLHLENTLKEKIPNSGILGKPHIESRIKTMKKDWQVVYDMVNGTNTSGFGYDSSTHSVTAEPAVWDSYIQVHKEAGKWRNEIFPHYEDLCIIFGKDRAQGNKAKDFAQMEEDATNEEQSEQIEDVFEEQTTENEESPNTGSKKRKRVDAVIKGITIAANVLGEKLEKMANSMNQAILGETEVQKKSFNGDS